LSNYAYRIQSRLDVFSQDKSKSFNMKVTVSLNKEDNRKWAAKKVDEFSFEY